MRLKTQTPAIVMCIAIVSIQFISCKKDNTVTANSLSSSINNNAVEDSATDSSLQKGLIAWYPFNGDVLDHSGNNNNVIFNSAVAVAGKSGVPKTAYKFNGTSSYMQVANSNSLNQLKISMCALIKPFGFYAGECHDNRIFSKGYNDYYSGRLDLGFNDQAYYNYTGCSMPVAKKFENFYGTFGDGGQTAGVIAANNYIKTGEWYSLVFTFDGAYSKIYINGKLINKAEGYTTFNQNTNDLFIGRNEDVNYPYYFKGIIDDLRIYKRALSASQVLSLYNTYN